MTFPDTLKTKKFSLITIVKLQSEFYDELKITLIFKIAFGVFVPKYLEVVGRDELSFCLKLNAA